MPKNRENLTLELIRSFESKSSAFENFLDRMLVESYTDFIEVLHKDIDKCIRELQRNRHLIDQKEDKITVQIVSLLRQQGYEATHDTQIGGHVDLTVSREEYLWLGEAKIHNGNSTLWEGLLQLTTRYSTGGDNENVGGLLIYSFKGNVKQQMDDWKKFITDKDVLINCTHTDCKHNQLAFYTHFDHDTSGLPYTIRHFPALFHFEPKDKSGRTSKGSE